MLAIRDYTNTECELNIAKTRLDFLIDKKTKLYRKYFPLVSNTKELMVDGGKKDRDNMAQYLHDLNEVDYGIGMSLSEEITFQQKRIEELTSYLNVMNDHLSKMNGIEYELYYEIVFNATPITKAVEEIAYRNDKDTQTIWKNYYRKIKKYIKKLKYTVNIQ